MNCDEAYEHLTDRYLHHSLAFQRHLAGCPRCQQMRETMRAGLAASQFGRCRALRARVSPFRCRAFENPDFR